jgi:hypothetical protein
MAVIGAHKMRLRSSAHSPHVLDSFYRHGGILAFSVRQSAKPIAPQELKEFKGTKLNQLSVFLCGRRVLSG